MTSTGGIRPYFRPRPLAAFALGISSGFPLTLLLATMTFWLSRVGIDKKTIGFAVGLTTPYTLKFLWAPLIDRIRLPGLAALVGQRRAWLFVVQALLAVAVVALGFSDPVAHLGRFAVAAIIVAFLSATQDIVIDAYRIELLSAAELAHGTAMNQFGYRTGNLIAGAGTVWLASGQGAGLGWSVAYALTALCILPGAVAALLSGPGLHEAASRAAAAQRRGADWFRTTVIAPFAEFLARRGAVLILVWIVVYKLGDAMGQIMLNPMIVELGYSDTDYIAANKLVGFWALIVGTACGAPLLARFGMARALVATSLLMCATNLGFAALATQPHSRALLGLAVGAENFSSGVGLTIFATYLSGLSNLAYTATQYALLSSLASVGRTFLTTPSGYVADAVGWPGFYSFTAAMVLPGVVLLLVLLRRGIIGRGARSRDALPDAPLASAPFSPAQTAAGPVATGP